ncbi:hypothetical protein LSTR_LSTR009282 [Laodelphax striatellus]|uniref:Uncharacterized protein n=1 Tax=Laodelphax striatellus TaxID=195883 RepID=A0A482XLS3_LAOST|nr:hypothetical protein LSTR_LSTR009282 [Laodelphax striatellus]
MSAVADASDNSRHGAEGKGSSPPLSASRARSRGPTRCQYNRIVDEEFDEEVPHPPLPPLCK